MQKTGRLSFLPLCVLAGILLAGLCLPAQGQLVSPWFRGGKAVWEALLNKAKLPAAGKAAFSQPLSNAATGYAVKTTASNWLRHRVAHSGVFSRMEKETLLQPNHTPKMQLGKIAYFHDRDARLFNWVPSQPGAKAEENAFWRHQNILANTLAELETFYRRELPEAFASSVFSKEQVARLMEDPIQPPAFVLYPKEIARFASLKTLAEQQAWAVQTLQAVWGDLNALLAKHPTRLQGNEFERYYIQKLRLLYFMTVQEVLAKATEKRPSLIVRRKRALKADLPGAERPEKALLKIREGLGLYANLRPAIMHKALSNACPIKRENIGDSMDLLIVRELTGGIYFGEHGWREGKYGQEAYDVERYSEMEIRRIAKVAFNAAMARKKNLVSVDKSNVLETSRLWRRVVNEMSADYPEVTVSHMYVDNAAMQLVYRPGQFDVLLTSNMFGDIHSDEASMITGSLGMLPSASLADGSFGL